MSEPVRAGWIEPLDVGLGAEPRPLALCEGHVPSSVLGDRLVDSCVPVEDAPGLAVPDRAERRQLRVERVTKRARFLDEPGVELLARAPVDPSGVDCRAHVEPNPPKRSRVAAWWRRRTVPGELCELERPCHATGVSKIRPSRALRRDDREASGGSSEAGFGKLALDPR